MRQKEAIHMDRSFKLYSRATASAAALIGALTLIGLIFDRPRLANMWFSSISMSANTALGFFVLGSALASFGLQPRVLWQKVLLRAAAYLVCVLGLLTMSQHLFGWDLHIDRLLLFDAARPARMSPITALSFAFIALAMILFAHGRAMNVARVINGVVGIVAFFAIFGYFYNVPAWYEIEPHAPTTLQTAFSFVLLVLSCIFALPNQGPMVIVASDTYAGELARRFLPTALLLPFVVGWLTLLGQERGAFSPQIGDAIAAMALIAFFFGLMLFQVKKLYRSELARREAQDALRESREELVRTNEGLEQKVQERTARLRETIGDLEYFSYSITHDMRAPLRAMQGFAQLLAESPLGRKQPEHDYIRRIASSAERMDKLIRDSLNYSKLVRQEMSMTSVAPARLLQEMIDTYPAFQSPRAEIHIEGEIPAVAANEAGLTQCFSNLLGNAVKFMPPGKIPRVRIWAELIKNGAPDSINGNIRIWFQDNGIGVPPQAAERIFDMFQRLNKDYEGTGIGLAIVRKVAARMGGRVGVESEPGRGSRFWLELPIAS